jgi:hypothetical protein
MSLLENWNERDIKMADESYFRGWSGTAAEAESIAAAQAVVAATVAQGGYALQSIQSSPYQLPPVSSPIVVPNMLMGHNPTAELQSIVQSFLSTGQFPSFIQPSSITALIGQIGSNGWNILLQGGAALIKMLAAAGVSVPSWVLAAVGLAAGAADLLTPGGLATIVPGGIDVGVTGPGILYSTVPGIKEHGGTVVKYWKPNPKTLGMVMTNTGWIAAARKDGTWRWYKPERPLTLTRKPSLMTVLKADSRLTRITKRIKRMIGRRL